MILLKGVQIRFGTDWGKPSEYLPPRYFKLCIRNTRDAVPKAVGYFLVRKMQEVLQFELYNQLASADRM